MNRGVLFLLLLTTGFCCAEVHPPERKVPRWARFERSIDVEGFVQRTRHTHDGNQSFRIQTRYLDPAVKASVGFIFGLHHFNEVLRLDEPPTLDTPEWLGNAGITLGLHRGGSLWKLDITGVLAGSTLGPALAIGGELPLNKHWGLFHRAEAFIFTGDTQDILLDADQGIYVQAGVTALTMGYRVVSGMHVNRSGPRVGIRLRFNSPKIPFIFPSLG